MEWIRGGLPDVGNHPQPLLRPACGGPAAALGGAGVLSTSLPCTMWAPPRRTAFDIKKHKGRLRQALGRHPVFGPTPSPTTCMRRWFFLFIFCAVVFLCAGDGRLLPGEAQLRDGQPAQGRRSTSLRFGTTRPSTPCCAPPPTRCSACRPSFWGLVVMAAAIVIPALLPWLDRSPVASMRCKGLASKSMLGVFVLSFLVLGYLGITPPSPWATALAQLCTVLYFAYFMLMPLVHAG